MATTSTPGSENIHLHGKPRCRLLVTVLQELATPVSAIEAANQIAKREHELPDESHVRAVYLSLCEHELPALEAADVVVYDRLEGTVSPGENFATVTQELQRVERSRPDANNESLTR